MNFNPALKIGVDPVQYKNERFLTDCYRIFNSDLAEAVASNPLGNFLATENGFSPIDALVPTRAFEKIKKMHFRDEVGLESRPEILQRFSTALCETLRGAVLSDEYKFILLANEEYSYILGGNSEAYTLMGELRNQVGVYDIDYKNPRERFDRALFLLNYYLTQGLISQEDFTIWSDDLEKYKVRVFGSEQ